MIFRFRAYVFTIGEKNQGKRAARIFSNNHVKRTENGTKESIGKNKRFQMKCRNKKEKNNSGKKLQLPAVGDLTLGINVCLQHVILKWFRKSSSVIYPLTPLLSIVDTYITCCALTKLFRCIDFTSAIKLQPKHRYKLDAAGILCHDVFVTIYQVSHFKLYIILKEIAWGR